MKTSTVLKKFSMVGAGSAAFLALSNFPANAVSVVRIPQSSFTPQAELITFSEFPWNTVNPTYNPADYGGNPLTAPTVTFGGFYQGQSLSANPGVDCPGGAATGCVVGTPTNPLALDPNSPNTFITTDGGNPTSPVLSGTPTFNGPITILFDKDMAGVGLDGGFFNAPNSTAIKAFARDGSFLGQVSNTGTGIEFLGLVTSDGSAAIAGLQFSLIGPEPAGFAIDSLRFGLPGQVNPPQKTPEPASVLGLLTIGVLGAGAAWKRKLK
ncbi:PEP-CTERM sorting domain-containing protein [Microcystis aeruginosa]|uniref:Ice-binding protein C-terminal domain-containing protein n=1 Tax=Microcystis aeruginosa NIES-2521 TaxID=2303983 RepID=A0A5A5RZU5_MICAE|nr:PEP-CTERM sorting domain-containing protein [Microcystis aeruginosa]GCA78642.1 hypothetical protein MiTs_00625 [Microcystis aeruginosa NIES-2521]